MVHTIHMQSRAVEEIVFHVKLLWLVSTGISGTMWQAENAYEARRSVA